MPSQRVLVVDDSRTLRRVVARVLEGAGYEVELAADGREAIERATAKVPDLVLTDFVMPHMNGLRFVQALRAVRNLARVPVVLMSAKADRIAESFVEQTGALDAITKPFSPEALLAVTTHALARASAADAAHAVESEASRARTSPGATEAPGAEPELDDAARREAAERIAQKLGELIVSSRVAMNESAVATAVLRYSSPDVLLSWASDLGALVPAARGEHALAGAIDQVALGDVLELLRHQRQTGALEIHGAGEARTITICFSQGAIDLALERPPSPETRIGRYAVEEGLVDAEELERVLGARTASRDLVGTRLVKLGMLHAADLTRLLTRQTSELVYEALRWRRGHYRFTRLATRPEASLARLAIPVSSVLMEGLRRVDEWRLVEEHVHSFDDVFVRDEEALARIDRHRLSREERTVLEAVDGARTVREIAAHARMGGFEVGKILFQLVTSRLVRRRA
ncbi:MAG: response regulator [Sandaracinus sp.]